MQYRTSKRMDQNSFDSCVSLKSNSASSFSITRKIIWWIFALCCTGMFVWECFQTIEDFTKQPYVTSLSAVENESVELPSIRICPSSWINYTALMEQNVTAQQLEMLMEGFVDPYLMDNNIMETNKLHFETEYNRLIQDRPGFDLRRFFRDQISLKCAEIFKYCSWQSEFYDCCDGEGDPLNVRKPLTNAGQCYLIYKRRYSPSDENFRQTMPGPGGGLIIQMALPSDAAEVPDLAMHVPSAQGITVNTQRGFEPTFTNPIAVPTAHEALLSVSARKTIRKHDCSDESQMSRNACMFECLVNATLAACGCTFFTFDSIVSSRQYCTPFGFATCVKPLMNRIKEIEDACSKAGSCPKPCVKWDFQQTVSVSPIHPRRFDMLMQRHGYAEQLNAKQVINIRVFYSVIGWELIEEFATLTPHTLISNIGGQLGLWLGFSMLSLIVSMLDAICTTSKMTSTGLGTSAKTKTKHDSVSVIKNAWKN